MRSNTIPFSPEPRIPGRCALDHAVGRTAPCPGSLCAFWEPGGAVLAGRCAFEQIDMSGRTELAHELLRIRDLLETPARVAADREARHLLHRLLNGSEDG